MIQSLRPEDRVKAAGLMFLAVAVFALAGFRAKVGNTGQTSTSETVVVGKQTPGAVTPATTTTDKTADKLIDVPLSTSAAKANPFKDVSGKPSPVAQSMESKPLPEAASQPYVPMKGELSPAPTGNEGHELSKNSDSPTIGNPDSVSVEGVIAGGQGVAVLKVGGADLVVRQGSNFGVGYRLLSVTSTQVVIQKGTKMETLTVTGG